MSELPDGWHSVLLEDVATWGSGGTPSRRNSQYYGGDIPWIKTGELDVGVIYDTNEKLTALGLQNSSAKLFPAGAIAIAMYGATIGKVSILGVDAATNQACAVAIPALIGLETKYLFQYLRSQKDAFIAAGKGGAQPNISQGVIKKWLFPLAPLPEQKRIADKLEAVLGRVDACRARLARVPDLLKRFRQSVLAAATSGRLTDDWRKERKVTDLWESVELGNLMKSKPRNGYSPRSVAHETPTRSLTLTATTSGRFRGEYSKFIDETIPPASHLWLRPNDILIQRANTIEYVGVSAIFDGPLRTFIYPDLMIKCRANELTTTEFLHILLQSEGVRQYFRENATGTAGNMPKINQGTVMTAPATLPTLTE